MPTIIIDEFAQAHVEGRKPKLTARMVTEIIQWYREARL